MKNVQDYNLEVQLIFEWSAQQDLEQDLQELVLLNIVHRNNMMLVSKLLNPHNQHASGLETWTLEEFFQAIEKHNDNTYNPALKQSRVEVPTWPAYSDLLKFEDVVTNYLGEEDSEEAKACGRALWRILRAFSAAQSKTLVQATMLPFLSLSS